MEINNFILKVSNNDKFLFYIQPSINESDQRFKLFLAMYLQITYSRLYYRLCSQIIFKF